MKALIINGSPRGAKSTSHALGGLLADGLAGHGVEVDHALALAAVHDPARTAAVLDAVDAADLLVLAFPLYVDSIPAPLTRLLEAIAARARARDGSSPKRRRLAVIVQCGFPEAAQCDTALAICRHFADAAGFEWAGGLAAGEGGMLGGGLDRIPPKAAARVRLALSSAAVALAGGQPIPDAAVEDLRRPLLRPWLYILFANLGWRMDARSKHAVRPLGHRPYAGRPKPGRMPAG
jgi:NAD(P)H-dependent FMN reductase